MDVVAVIVAAGRGSRAGEGLPKQYRSVGRRPVLARTLDAFLRHEGVTQVVCAIHPDDRALYEDAVAGLPVAGKLLEPIAGGATRQASVRNALEELTLGEETLCLVHDAARPFVDAALISRAIAAGRRHGAAVPGVAVTDTTKRVDADGFVQETLDRRELRAIQTPQAFRLGPLRAAHRAAAAETAGRDFTDDGHLAEWAGTAVHVFEGDPLNTKVTHPADFEAAERRLGADAFLTRVGTGFDVHAFGEGDHVWLGGVQIAHDRGVLAHSDGDVVLHALTDALLGAIGDGDIGTHFPPSDPQWRGASSDRFLAYAAERVRERGGRIDHLDVTVLCERPRIGPHRDAIRARIAAVAGVALGAVSVKATTTEKLGFTGRSEGLAAQAAATIRLPEGA
ncbi:MAG: bifunctional 2-C-methyl-D-erythritol 4-phosphate cytidylyltransferase/2-C-methyl-D-erythritol 2,4-cyclodiphosphate synthase [Methylobacteriaceae bacterium]|nr:bifunctional 2-C-methyl-D-erythritol 4-phosphate cytidylyltransferase/2-C-methyl-D-erythritol 2,4-cyclodiphosphate synthase [Methylobacteriaceae bacterium]